jgi:hypothetical protein
MTQRLLLSLFMQIPQDVVHEATELAYLEFSTQDGAAYSIQQQQHHQQPTILEYDQPHSIRAPHCSIFRPASPRPRSGRSYSTEKMSSVLRRVRLNGKRGHTSTISLNNIEESLLTAGGGVGGATRETREKRARVGRPPQFESVVHVGGNVHNSHHNGPAPMSP